MKFADKLKKMGACPEAIKWVGNKTFKQAFDECERGDWMFWYLERVAKTKAEKKALALAACDCAERALKFIPAGEDRPRQAIKAARKYLKYPTEANKSAVVSAAHAAAHAADATYATAHAAYATADAAAVSERKAQADITRKRWNERK